MRDSWQLKVTPEHMNVLEEKKKTLVEQVLTLQLSLESIEEQAKGSIKSDMIALATNASNFCDRYLKDNTEIKATFSDQVQNFEQRIWNHSQAEENDGVIA
ncbi:hypothetical protein P3342_002256 [Pyrenophora teres f. teres]|nr:hypothetical protein P3342_002256 [Pyrenophora teres f. teres]